jgi:hypothetical protein
MVLRLKSKGLCNRKGGKGRPYVDRCSRSIENERIRKLQLYCAVATIQSVTRYLANADMALLLNEWEEGGLISENEQYVLFYSSACY